jgi:hypothetical protein
VQVMIARSREQRQRAGTQHVAAESGTREKCCAFQKRAGRPARISPDPLPAECCREWNPKWSRCTVTCRIGFNLHEAIRNRDADIIRSYRRALNSGIARAHETANREADARGWDPAVVDGMLQEVEESTATLLPAAEKVLLELEEEARANWEERAVYQATQVINLAGEAFETLSENRWSRRDCTEYQEELDWMMRTF